MWQEGGQSCPPSLTATHPLAPSLTTRVLCCLTARAPRVGAAYSGEAWQGLRVSTKGVLREPTWEAGRWFDLGLCHPSEAWRGRGGGGKNRCGGFQGRGPLPGRASFWERAEEAGSPLMLPSAGHRIRATFSAFLHLVPLCPLPPVLPQPLPGQPTAQSWVGRPGLREAGSPDATCPGGRCSPSPSRSLAHSRKWLN